VKKTLLPLRGKSSVVAFNLLSIKKKEVVMLDVSYPWTYLCLMIGRLTR
jgi:hypothetical protein